MYLSQSLGVLNLRTKVGGGVYGIISLTIPWDFEPSNRGLEAGYMEYYLSKSLGIINLRTNCEEKPCSILQLGLFVTPLLIFMFNMFMFKVV